MGVTMNFQIEGNCDYSNAIHEIEGAFIYRSLRPWLYPDIIFNLTTVGKKFKSNVRLLRGLSKKETMRLYPVIPVITRENDQEFKVLNHTVGKGTVCAILFTALHRDPEVFPDPEKFDPDRFLPENCAGRHPYAYIPFSAGPRNCIGQKFAMMEAKTILACILAHFRVKSLDKRDKVLFYPNITLRNAYPMRLSFELR
ncbi:Cytochrome P450 4V2 like protein [Argiope bruennichi]|uniref:Cytochrome P450 4V2 like protein n=1 Tax=Argiope bruennichi TaxID=94029 RepID=A0A8T0ECN7_ARGBR|nr:Cytochrome P450 4V2 like protein [Argiope bruennichi]